MTDTWRKIAIPVLVGVLLVAAFSLAPVPVGDDWEVFFHTGVRLRRSESIYGEPIHEGFYFYNAPWLAVLFAALSFLPLRLGWALLSAATLALTVLVARRWSSGLVRPLLVCFSPPLFYTLLHGQVDALVLAGVLLPKAYWGLVGLSKPQVGIALLLGGFDRRSSLRIAAVTAAGLLLSFLLFGLWPLQVLRQPAPVGAHNLWFGLWPFQVSAGLAIAFWGLNRREERLLLAASPLFLPYAATSSLLGTWIALATLLKRWQVAVVLLAWWGAVIYRFLGF
jgi:hypothetical protein